MPGRRIDPTTGEPELTYRESGLVDEYIANGGNGAQAAAAAGYIPSHAAQAAAVQLARLKQISDSKSAVVDQSKLSEEEQQKLRIERIIASALNKYLHKTREQAIKDLGEIRPEFLPHLDDLPDVGQASSLPGLRADST